MLNRYDCVANEIKSRPEYSKAYALFCEWYFNTKHISDALSSAQLNNLQISEVAIWAYSICISFLCDNWDEQIVSTAMDTMRCYIWKNRSNESSSHAYMDDIALIHQKYIAFLSKNNIYTDISKTESFFDFAAESIYRNCKVQRIKSKIINILKKELALKTSTPSYLEKNYKIDIPSFSRYECVVNEVMSRNAYQSAISLFNKMAHKSETLYNQLTDSAYIGINETDAKSIDIYSIWAFYLFLSETFDDIKDISTPLEDIQGDSIASMFDLFKCYFWKQSGSETYGIESVKKVTYRLEKIHEFIGDKNIFVDTQSLQKFTSFCTKQITHGVGNMKLLLTLFFEMNNYVPN